MSITQISKIILLDVLQHFLLLVIETIEDGVKVDVEDVHLAHPQQGGGNPVLHVDQVEVDTQFTKFYTLTSTVGTNFLT